MSDIDGIEMHLQFKCSGSGQVSAGRFHFSKHWRGGKERDLEEEPARGRGVRPGSGSVPSTLRNLEMAEHSEQVSGAWRKKWQIAGSNHVGPSSSFKDFDFYPEAYGKSLKKF